jgi:hypothetical protein
MARIGAGLTGVDGGGGTIVRRQAGTGPDDWPPAAGPAPRSRPEEVHRVHEQLPRAGYREAAVAWAEHTSPDDLVRRDPLGGEAVARAAADAKLDIVPTGHIPWLARLDQTATLIGSFLAG